MKSLKLCTLITCILCAHACSQLSKVEDVCTQMDDINFMSFCYEHFDVNKDGVVSLTEAEAVKKMEICNKGIISLKGIERFVSLLSLDCSNNDLASLDVSKNNKLSYLNCANNNLKSLDVSQNIDLVYLNCEDNKLSALDVSSNTNLTSLYCGYNLITSLDVSNNVYLTDFICSGNLLTVLDISQNINLKDFDFHGNQIAELDLSGLLEFPYYGQYQWAKLVQKNLPITVYLTPQQINEVRLYQIEGLNINVVCLGCTNWSQRQKRLIMCGDEWDKYVFTYNADGKIALVNRNEGERTWTFTWTENKATAKYVKDGEYKGDWTFELGSNGYLTTQANELGDTWGFTYDDEGHLTQITLVDKNQVKANCVWFDGNLMKWSRIKSSGEEWKLHSFLADENIAGIFPDATDKADVPRWMFEIGLCGKPSKYLLGQATWDGSGAIAIYSYNKDVDGFVTKVFKVYEGGDPEIYEYAWERIP